MTIVGIPQLEMPYKICPQILNVLQAPCKRTCIFNHAVITGAMRKPVIGVTPLWDERKDNLWIERECPLHELLETDILAVNSCHHQGIAELSPELIPMATAEDGLVEAVRMKGKSFVWAVQWHPEMSLCEVSSQKLFGVFVDACR
jgi:putative glutamine amidotransferase